MTDEYQFPDSDDLETGNLFEEEGQHEQPEQAAQPLQPAPLTAEEIAEAVRTALSEQSQAQAPPQEEEPNYGFYGQDITSTAIKEAVEIMRLHEEIVPKTVMVGGQVHQVPQEVADELRSEVRKIHDSGQLRMLKDGGYAEMVVKAKMFDLQSSAPAQAPSVSAEPVSTSAAYGGVSVSEIRELESILGVKITKEDLQKYGR